MKQQQQKSLFKFLKPELGAVTKSINWTKSANKNYTIYVYIFMDYTYKCLVCGNVNWYRQDGKPNGVSSRN